MPFVPTVLVAEDDPVFRRLLEFTLEKCGMNVVVASDGMLAYERFLEGGIDLLVTDHQMPRASGIELLENILANESIPSPRSILCTAKGLELDTDALMQQFGLLAIMHKPFSPRKLSELLQSEAATLSAEIIPTEPSDSPQVSRPGFPFGGISGGHASV